MRTSALFLHFLLIYCFSGCIASAQATPDVDQGFRPYGSYEGGDIDTVNLSNGNLTLHIPVLSYPQLGKVKLDFTLVYNAQPWRTLLLAAGTSDPVYTEQYGNTPCVLAGVVLTSNLAWCGTAALLNNAPQAPPATPVLTGTTHGTPEQTNSTGATATWELYTMYDPFGGAHEFVPTTSAMTNYLSLDASGMKMNTGVFTADGVFHTTNPDNSIGVETDQFGNTVQGDASTGWTDSTGRTIPAPQSTSIGSCPTGTGTATSWTVPAFASGGNGTATYISCFTVISITSNFPFNTQTGISPRYANGSASPSLLTALILPNGQQWTFTYDGQGDLKQLTFPTGGSISYTWAPLLACSTAGVEKYSMGVTSRIVNPGNGEPSSTWTYNTLDGQVTDPMGNVTVHTFTEIGGCSLYETNTAYYQGASTLIKTVSTQYSGTTNPNDLGVTAMNVVPTSITTTLASGEQSVSVKTYDSGISVYNQTWPLNEQPNPYTLIYGSLLSTMDYDFGVPATGTPTRTTSTTWQWQQNSAYLTAGLMNYPATKQVLNSAGQRASYTTYTYDETAYSPGGVLGQPTTTVQYLGNNPGPTIHTGWLSNGEKSYIIDADDHLNGSGHTADYKYNECGGSAVTDTYDALTHHTSGTYDCNSGLVTSITDPNSQTTTYSYDELSRPTQVVSPSVALLGGSSGNPTTTFQYNDSAKTVTETVLAAPDPTQTTEVAFDGLGREIHRYITDSSSTQDKVDTNYDLLGRVASVSNPYRSTSDSTYGITSYTYDALGRKVIQTQPDGSTMQWCYDGVGGVSGQTICTSNLSSDKNASWVDSTDETGRHWQRASDSFGRLVAVMEPSPTTNTPTLQTVYSYDTLNNLLSVNQKGVSGETARTRSFTYDSLSRLLTAANPETGTISYGYDANSNLTSKTDARGILTTYSYDALNRLASKVYSDGTLSAVFGYDGHSQNGGVLSTPTTNAIGRLSHSSNAVNGAINFSYDAMGRVTKQNYCIPTNCSYALFASETYDLAGNLSSQTYPDGRTVTQTNDGAGRMASLTYTGWNGTAQTIPYLTIPSSDGYDPAGHLINATMGNGVSIAVSYNNRERITALAYGTSTQLLWGKALAWTANGNLQTASDPLRGVQRQFAYDNLNRLTSAQDIFTATAVPDPSPFPVGAGEPTSSVVTPDGATPQWTNPDDSNILINPDNPNAAGFALDAVTLTQGVTAPDGSTTAFTITGISSDSYVTDAADINGLVDGESMVASVWLRCPAGTQTVNLYLAQTGGSGFVIAAWKSVTVTTVWQQFQVGGQFQYGHTISYLQIGGGDSIAAGQAVSVWNPMLENYYTSGPTITNFLPYSQRLTAPSWQYTTSAAVDNSATAPDGTNTAATVTASASGSAFVDVVKSPAPDSGTPVVGSVWLRLPSGSGSIAVALIEVGASGSATLDATTVSLTTTWQRFQVTGTTQSTLTELELQVGEGGSFTTGQSVQVWGAQMELASLAGPYVATAGSIVSIEDYLTNGVPYSQQPNGPSWTISGATGVPNAVAAPDGSMTGYEMTASSGVTNATLSDSVTNPGLYDGTVTVASIYLRSPNGPESVQFSIIGQNASGEVGLSETFQLTSTWQRFEVTGAVPNGLTLAQLQVGGGNTLSAGEKVDVWGAQLQMSINLGPYVMTSSLPVFEGVELSNILPNSQQLSGPSWAVTNGSATVNSGAAPDGTTTAATITALSASKNTYVTDAVPNPSLYDSEYVSGSIYLRVASGTLNTYISLVNIGDSGQSTVASTAVSLTTTWQRFSVRGTNQDGLTELLLMIGGSQTVTAGQTFQVWGAQMAIGGDPAPYMPTNTTTTNEVTGQTATFVTNGLDQSYTYDSFGNLQQNGSFNAIYTAQNQMAGYVYDASGNLLANGINNMTWDAESRISSTGGATYIYDGDGNRVEKQGVSVTDTIFFGSRPLARYSAGSWIDLIYGPNGLIAEVPGTETGQANYRAVDHLGNQVGWALSDGLLADQLDYTPFGQILSGGTNDPYQFTGKERDSESANDYFGARYYASSMGRWMSPDWADKPEAVPYSSLDNPQTLNLYSYVGNNPLSRVDADGHVEGPNDSQPIGSGGADFLQDADHNIKIAALQARAQQQSTPQTSDNTLLAQNNTPPPPGRTPAQGGTPGSTVVIPDGKGGSTTRTYGPDGKATTDIDTGHDHGAGDPHAHDWDWGTKPPRQPGRPLTPEEQANIKKTAAGVVVGVGTGYIIYRVIRFLPSLAPPLWPTIPANAIIP